MTIPYQYNCIDKSIVLPFYKKYYVSFFFRFVPAWLTANFITIISTGFVGGMLFVSLVYNDHGSPFHALIFAFCLHNYLLGDHLDGMQAKESGTSSPLGEFMDHYLDVYNGAIVLLTLSVFLGPLPKTAFLVLMVLNCIAFAATMVEELENRMLIFGFLGTLEGVLILITFYLSWLIPSIREMWNHELLPGYPAYWIVIIGLGVGYLYTTIDILFRLRRIPKPFAVFCCACAMLACLLVLHPVSQFWAWLLLILFSGDYIARVMQGYLLSGPHPYPDILSSILLFLVLLGNVMNWVDTGVIQIFYLFLSAWFTGKVICSFGITFYKLRENWFWLNPK